MTQPAKKYRILIVDDYPNSLYVMQLILEDPNYEIITAASAEIALRELMQQQIDLLILDVIMPDMNGYELASLLRENQRLMQLPIIFLTGNNLTNEYKRYGPGPVEFLIKPIEADRLKRRVASLLTEPPAQLSRRTDRLSLGNAK